MTGFMSFDFFVFINTYTELKIISRVKKPTWILNSLKKSSVFETPFTQYEFQIVQGKHYVKINKNSSVKILDVVGYRYFFHSAIKKFLAFKLYVNFLKVASPLDF